VLLHTAFFHIPLAEPQGACSRSRAGDGECGRREKGKEWSWGACFYSRLLWLHSPGVKETPVRRLGTVLCKIGSVGDSHAPVALTGMHTPRI